MESPSSPSRPRDRISELPDDLLGHILSFLPNVEAGRAAALSRRWCDVFGHVHTVAYEEPEGERDADWYTTYLEATELRSCSSALYPISAALLCRRRCTGGHVPLRTFRFALDKFMDGWDTAHVDQWLSYVLEYAGQELNLDLRFVIQPICEHDSYINAVADDDAGSDSDEDETGLYILPKRVFSCAALKTLSLSHCMLNLPENIHLPSLETLRLTNIRHESGRSVQRLVSSCPRLADLTLEAIHHLRTLAVLHRRLRRFALRCCHSAKSVHIEASELRSLEYRGSVPHESLLTLHGVPAWQGIPSCTVDFCMPSPVSKNAAKITKFRTFVWRFAAAERLHLHHGRLHSKCLTEGLPSFFHMTRLTLQGRVDSPKFIGAVHGMLKQTPNLEVLSLHMAEEKVRRWERAASGDAWKGGDASVVVPDGWGFSKTPCLRLRLREIIMEHYDGNETQRTLAGLLLRNAIILDRLRVVFVSRRSAVQARLKKEIESWAKDGSERIFM